jgi:peptide/nickel transport system permease protein
VRAAHAIGCRDERILLRHILPNVLAPIVVLTTLDIAWAILSASSLSFLGLGAQPPTPEWGAMLASGRNYLRAASWVSTIPGLAIMAVVFGFNVLGDGLRDAMDPRMKK